MGKIGPLLTAGRTLTRLALGLLLLTALAFRLIGLDHLPGINGDEAYYGSVVVALEAGKHPPLVTGSHLPLNPCYTGPLYLLHLAHPTPSFWLLRLLALLSGVLLLVLAFPLLSRVFDRATAAGTTLLLACLPVAIAYSRIGWDQSQAPLAALVCLYFALRRRGGGGAPPPPHPPWAPATAFLVALVIHPLNVFLLPILLGPAALGWCARVRQLSPAERTRCLRRLGAVLAGGGLLCAVVLWLLLPAVILDTYLRQKALRDMGHRLGDPSAALDFAWLYADWLSGTTIYRYFAGPVPAGVVWLGRGLFVGVLVFLLGTGVPRLVRRRDLPALGLVAGLGFSLLAAYVLIGPNLLQPGLERYGTWLVTPSCLALALLLPRRWATGGLLVIGGLLLLGFWRYYFVVLRETGGEAHRTFRTAAVEPKQAAFAAVIATAGGQPATVLAEDWWVYYPLYYLAADRPELRVVACVRGADDAGPRRRFLVGFAGGPCDRWLTWHAVALPKETVVDYAGRPVLYVWDLGTSEALLPGLAAAARAVDVPLVFE